MRIFVVTDSQALEIEIHKEETVYDLMKKISTIMKVPTSSLVLSFDSKILDPSSKISSLYIISYSTVRCIIKNPIPQDAENKPFVDQKILNNINSIRENINNSNNFNANNSNADLDGGNDIMNQMLNDPNFISNAMKNPAVKSLMENPKAMTDLLGKDPRFAKVMKENPELRNLFNNKAMMKEITQIASNPSTLQELLKSTDKQLTNIEAMPGGHASLRNAYNSVQKPMESALKNLTGLYSGKKVSEREILKREKNAKKENKKTEEGIQSEILYKGNLMVEVERKTEEKVGEKEEKNEEVESQRYKLKTNVFGVKSEPLYIKNPFSKLKFSMNQNANNPLSNFMSSYSPSSYTTYTDEDKQTNPLLERVTTSVDPNSVPNLTDPNEVASNSVPSNSSPFLFYFNQNNNRDRSGAEKRNLEQESLMDDKRKFLESVDRMTEERNKDLVDVFGNFVFKTGCVGNSVEGDIYASWERLSLEEKLNFEIRNEKSVKELRTLGFDTNDEVLKMLYESNNNIEKAIERLLKLEN